MQQHERRRLVRLRPNEAIFEALAVDTNEA
jgi:hypothetical protein